MRPARLIGIAAFGILLGFTLSRVGFTDFDTVHAMFTVQDLRLYFVFAGGLGLTAIGFKLVGASRVLNDRFIHRGTIIGSLFFGAGWAITGACPGVIFAQLGEGQLPALASLGGIVLGSLVYRWLQPRYFRWDQDGCG